MPNKCFVPGCSSGYAKNNAYLKAEGKQIPSMFHPTENVLSKWNNKIPRKDRDITVKDVVCALHFKEDCIVTRDEFKMPDGIITHIKRKKPYLIPAAVPSIFLGLPDRFTDFKIKRAPPKERNIKNTKDISVQNTINTNDPLVEAQTDTLLYQNVSNCNSKNNDGHNMFNVKFLHEISQSITLPGNMWGVHSIPKKKIVFIHLNNSLETDKSVLFTNTCTPQVAIHKTQLSVKEVKSKHELEKLLRQIDEYVPCVGFSDDGSKSKICKGFVESDISSSKAMIRCKSCASERRRQQKQKPVVSIKKVQNLSKCLKNKNQQRIRLKQKLVTLKQLLWAKQDECKLVTKQTIDNCITKLPKEQQELVKAIISAAKCKSIGRRYSLDWIYECILMRIKGPKLYKKLRVENKLPLPSEKTLGRYIKKLRPAYGFQENTFHILKEKSKQFSIEERHGCLLLDEMHLESTLKFQRDSLQLHGFVDLGQFTLDKDAGKKGDHALVVMFQPFRGQWVQAIGAFLSAGAVNGAILEKLVTEAIILLENSGYFVDFVTTDGATWNRTMWNKFGVSAEITSCVHPTDSDRRLWFGSDFPHLVKCLWHRIVTKKILKIPEGVVRLDHWAAIVSKNINLGIKVCYTLTPDHIHPSNYQKMNVRMAMQFFSHSVAVSMEHYRKQKDKSFEDSLPTIAFIKRINSVIDAMNSQQPSDALMSDPSSTHHLVLTNFLQYLKLIDEMSVKSNGLLVSSAKKQTFCGGGAGEMTSSTFFGLYVTVQNTLELVQYLSEKVGYRYLMTRKINQDALEHFFGHMRGACGSNSHPDSLLFIQVYRLLNTYSLVKPIRGSNVAGNELLTSIMSLKDLIGTEFKIKKEGFEKSIDEIIDNGTPLMSCDFDEEHTKCTVDKYALTVFAGYISRKVRKMNPAKNCIECFNSLCASEKQDIIERETFLQLKSLGGLLRPSTEVYDIIFQLETIIVETLKTQKLHKDILFSILEEITVSSNILKIGCPEQNHQKELTSAILTFFLICRMHFVCAEAMSDTAEKKKRKQLGKLSKL